MTLPCGTPMALMSSMLAIAAAPAPLHTSFIVIDVAPGDFERIEKARRRR